MLDNELKDYNKAFNYALNVLGRCDKTESQISSKLKSKNFSDVTLECVIEKLKEIDLINDERYVENWLNLKKDTQGFNKRVAINKLLQKGIDKELVLLKTNEIDIDEYSAAKLTASKKIRTMSGEEETKKIKISNFLLRKGYSYDIVRKVVNEVINGEEIGNEYE